MTNAVAEYGNSRRAGEAAVVRDSFAAPEDPGQDVRAAEAYLADALGRSLPYTRPSTGRGRDDDDEPPPPPALRHASRGG